jgi:hypothetical protein
MSLLTVRVARLGVSEDDDDTGFDRSQSMSHPWPSESIMIFAGLKSRCKIPASYACLRAKQQCMIILVFSSMAEPASQKLTNKSVSHSGYHFI